MSKLYFVQMTKNKLRFAVPLIALFVLIPALAALILTGPESDIKMADCIRQLHVWVPLFSTWWILLYAGDFFSHDGNELMYLIWKPHQIIALRSGWCVWVYDSGGTFVWRASDNSAI